MLDRIVEIAEQNKKYSMDIYKLSNKLKTKESQYKKEKECVANMIENVENLKQQVWDLTKQKDGAEEKCAKLEQEKEDL